MKGYSKDPPAWITSSAEMWRKTAIIRLCKRLDLSPEKADSLNQAIHMDHQAESGEGQDVISAALGDAALGEGDEASKEQEATLDDFERLANENAKTKNHRQKLDQFVSVTAKHQNVSEEQIKLQAVARWDEFWKAFETWKKRNQSSEQPQEPNAEGSTGEDTGQPAESSTADAQAESSVIECPNQDNRPISKQYCNETCTQRDGCPAWD